MWNCWHWKDVVLWARPSLSSNIWLSIPSYSSSPFLYCIMWVKTIMKFLSKYMYIVSLSCNIESYQFRSLQFYSILGNNQFLYIDLVLTTLLALSLGRASPGPILTKQSPPVSLVAMTSILPLIIQVVVVLIIQLASIYLLQSQIWWEF